MKLNDVNDDILDNIISYLSISEKVAVQRVCQRWKTLISNQFKHERHLLITLDLQMHQSSDLINYYLNKPLNDLNFSYFQTSNSSLPSLNFIETSPPIDYPYTLITISMNKLNFEQFETLIAKFPNTNSLAFCSIKNCQLISSKTLDLTLNNCLSLTTIDLSRCEHLDTDCLKVIANNCRTLERLDLTNSRKYGNNGLKCVLRQCPKLKALFIGYNRHLTGQFFQRSLARLSYLDLTRCTNFTFKGLNAMVDSMACSLISLVSFPINSNDRLKYVCTNFPNLRIFKFCFTVPVDLRILIDQSHFHHLSSLSLNNCVQLTDDLFIRMMTNFKYIEQFELCPGKPIQIYLPILDLAKYWSNLTKLRLINITLAPLQNTRLLKSFLNLTCLDSICISLTEIDDVATLLERLFNERLKYLNLEYFQKKSSDPFTISSMSAIKKLLNSIESKGYLVRLNQQDLPYFCLTKIAIRKY